VKRLPLGQNLFARLDDEDHRWLSRFRWRAEEHWGKFYASRKDGEKTVWLARQLVSAEPNQLGLFNDGNPLNCQRSNLRVLTRSEQAMSRDIQPNNKTGYRGVSKRENGEFASVIYAKRKRHFLGYFDDAKAAAEKYNEAAAYYHGPFARPNQIV
jgi:hypothetical protein